MLCNANARLNITHAKIIQCNVMSCSAVQSSITVVWSVCYRAVWCHVHVMSVMSVMHAWVQGLGVHKLELFPLVCFRTLKCRFICVRPDCSHHARCPAAAFSLMAMLMSVNLNRGFTGSKISLQVPAACGFSYPGLWNFISAYSHLHPPPTGKEV